QGESAMKNLPVLFVFAHRPASSQAVGRVSLDSEIEHGQIGDHGREAQPFAILGGSPRCQQQRHLHEVPDYVGSLPEKIRACPLGYAACEADSWRGLGPQSGLHVSIGTLRFRTLRERNVRARTT